MDEKDSGGKRSSSVFVSESPEETFRLGQLLGKGLRGGDCVALTGELGAGKTSLTQGIAKGLGVPDHYIITSPTFTLINEYPGRQAALYHLDVYRLEDFKDLEEMGYEEYLLGVGVVVIEWAEKIPEALPQGAIRVEISYLSEYRRKIEISCLSERMDLWTLDPRKGGF